MAKMSGNRSRYDNLVDCGNSDVYNSQLTIKIKGKNDSQSRMA
jgi:hypothetical protein